MKKVIVTGVTGFIGYHLFKHLINENIIVWVVLREDSKDLDAISRIRNTHVIICNLSDILSIDEKCEERGFDAFFHLAWEGASGDARLNYNLQVDNAKWTVQCVEAAKKLECKKIIVTGTVCEKQCIDIVSSSQFIRNSNYLLAKDYARNMSFSLSRYFDIPVVWCQFYHPIGVFNKKNQIITNTIYKLKNGEELKLGKCETLFDVIDVEDLVRGMYLIAEKITDSDTIFLGSGNPKKLKNYIIKISELIDSNSEISFTDTSKDDLIIDKEWLGIECTKKRTGYEPQIDFENSVLEISKWLDNEDKYDAEKWNF